ncbi:hypothetical protein HMPREF1529_02346 [Microbacterium sp. oral taxon 186 str. F0373]|uniref:Uncharacterized protein n=1 Tax=Microbacterium hominis TaxID=162426 RepID=A0A2K9DY51_9MICO|nr:hypothetical protein CXR34_09000 [Microbacterium hominis]EPD84281.1 hypothetical protein HMPREF1529_02346 [Microbacterium sp. oral taxon 186 str. F0373]
MPQGWFASNYRSVISSMANPFLVLGGIAVGIVTAGIGVLAVPGWIGAAQDSAAVNDLSVIRAAESAAVLHLGEYTDDDHLLASGELGVKVQASAGTDLVGLSADADRSWCAVTRSKTGVYFAASQAVTSHASNSDPSTAMSAAGCTSADADAVLAAGFGAFVEESRNLALNPLGGAWKPTSQAGIGFDTTRWGAYGAYSLQGEWVRFTRTTANNSSYGFHLSGNPESAGTVSAQMMAVVPGETYTLSLDARLSAGGSGDSQLRVRYANELNQWVATPPSAIAISGISDETRTYTLTFIPPAGATRIAAYFVSSAVPAGGYIEATHLFLSRGATPARYFDETTPVDYMHRFAWTGPRNLSESVMLIRSKG